MSSSSNHLIDCACHDMTWQYEVQCLIMPVSVGGENVFIFHPNFIITHAKWSLVTFVDLTYLQKYEYVSNGLY